MTMTVELSPVIQRDAGFEVCTSDEATAFGVYIKVPEAMHVRDFDIDGSLSQQDALMEATVWAQALANHIGADLDARHCATAEVSRHDEAEAAMCIWEAILSTKDSDPQIAHHFFHLGTGEIRHFALSLAKPCHLAWLKDAANGFDDSLDWDFVPAWLTDNVDWTGAKPTLVGRA